MGTVARPLSAEQELATQQVQLAHPPSSDHTTAQHHRIIATVSPRYQHHHHQQHGRSSEPRSHWPLLVSSLVLRAAHQEYPYLQPASPSLPRCLRWTPPASTEPGCPSPLPSDPVIGMLHPGIFLASSLLLAHGHGDLQPSKLHRD